MWLHDKVECNGLVPCQSYLRAGRLCVLREVLPCTVTNYGQVSLHIAGKEVPVECYCQG